MLTIYFPAKEKDSTHVSITYENYVLAMPNNYYVIKNIRLHKLATFNTVLLRHCIYFLTLRVHLTKWLEMLYS